MKFVCAQCQGTRIEEIMADVTETINVEGVDADGNLEYGDHSSEGGYVHRYQCIKCGEALVADDGMSRPANPEQLIEWLKEHKML